MIIGSQEYNDQEGAEGGGGSPSPQAPVTIV